MNFLIQLLKQHLFLQKLPSIRPLNGIHVSPVKLQPIRTNGNSPFRNIVHKKQGPIYGKTQSMQFQVQQQPAKTVHSYQNNLKSQQRSLSSSLTAPQTPISSSHNQYRPPLQPHKVTKIFQPPPPPAPCLLTTLPPSSNTTAPPSNGKSTTSYTTDPPPLYQQPRNFITESKSQTKQLHSKTPVTPHPASKQSQTINPKSAVQYPQLTQNQQQQQLSRSNIENISHIDVERCIIGTPIKCENFNSVDHCSEFDSSYNSVATASKCYGNSSSSTSSTESSSNTFVRPKVEAKVFIAGKKSTGKSQTKRSYSQSSHHEALQRIPSRAAYSTTNLASDAATNLSHHVIRNQTEWHAPGTFIYEYAEPGCMSADQVDLYATTQNVWYKNDSSTLPTRELKLENKLNQLRRQAFQFAEAQSFRSTNIAKRRLLAVAKALRKTKNNTES